MLRLFVGLSLPDDIANRLAMLADSTPGARWVEPENLHITLRFIGEVSEADAEDIHHNLARLEARAFSFSIGGLDTFGQGRKAHALYMRVTPGPELELLQGRIDSAVVKSGQPRETRKFKPHITLARLKGVAEDRLLSFIQSNNLFRAGPIAVNHFVLFESRMGNGGSTYIPLQEYPLG